MGNTLTTAKELAEWDAFSSVLSKRFGLAFPPGQKHLLLEKLRRSLRDSSWSTVGETMAAAKQGDARALTHAVNALTVGETYFLRNRAQFEALHQVIIPELLQTRRDNKPLVFWSAGCATGEEAYSLAMWVREYFPALWPDQIRIVATDLNERSLALAKQGRYRSWSFRRVESKWLERYFEKQDDEWVVRQDLRAVTDFAQHNLASNMLPADLKEASCDIVFCRNVLIYFTPTSANSALQLFSRSLHDRGALVLGHVESIPALKSWRYEYFPGAFFYRIPGVEPPADASSLHRVQKPPAKLTRSAIRTEGPASSTIAKASPRPVTVSTTAAQVAESNTDKHFNFLRSARRAADAGDFEQAQRLIQEALHFDRTNFEAHLLASVINEQLGELSLAREALKRALFLNKHSVLAHYFVAMLAERENEEDAALRSYRTVDRLLSTLDTNAVIEHSEGLLVRHLHELVRARVSELSQEA